jgi:hypothetical protein
LFLEVRILKELWGNFPEMQILPELDPPWGICGGLADVVGGFTTDCDTEKFAPETMLFAG